MPASSCFLGLELVPAALVVERKEEEGEEEEGGGGPVLLLAVEAGIGVDLVSSPSS